MRSIRQKRSLARRPRGDAGSMVKQYVGAVSEIEIHALVLDRYTNYIVNIRMYVCMYVCMYV